MATSDQVKSLVKAFCDKLSSTDLGLNATSHQTHIELTGK